MLDLVHLKKDCTYASFYYQRFMEIRDRHSDYIPVYTDGSRDGRFVACATVFQTDTVISMRFHDSASIFTAEVWANIKALEKIKIQLHPNILVFRHTFVFPFFTVYEAGTAVDWNGDT